MVLEDEVQKTKPEEWRDIPRIEELNNRLLFLLGYDIAVYNTIKSEPLPNQNQVDWMKKELDNAFTQIESRNPGPLWLRLREQYKG